MMDESTALIKFDKMAIKLALKYSSNHEFDDLYQVAKIGIVEAVRTFDATKNAKLSTHVFNMIIFNLKKFCSRNTGIIYYPQNSIEKYSILTLDEATEVPFEDQNFINIEINNFFDNISCDLTDKQKNIIKLKFLDGLSVTEIANKYKCSHQNISNICLKAQYSIKDNLKQMGYDF